MEQVDSYLFKKNSNNRKACLSDREGIHLFALVLQITLFRRFPTGKLRYFPAHGSGGRAFFDKRDPVMQSNYFFHNLSGLSKAIRV
jgi:hypothetical protein